VVDEGAAVIACEELAFLGSGRRWNIGTVERVFGTAAQSSISIAGMKGDSAAKLDTVDISYNTFDDTAGTMSTALNLNIDGAAAAKDVRQVGNTLTGGCRTLLSGTMTGNHQSFTVAGDRRVTP
jgi:hypothetical protein